MNIDQIAIQTGVQRANTKKIIFLKYFVYKQERSVP